MKILCVGDFDGKFPKKYLDIIKKEKINLVISDGDYPPFSLRKEFFKYVYRKGEDVNLWDFIGKKKYKESIRKDHKKGEAVLKKLNKLNIPVFTVLGNHDHSPNDVYNFRKPRKGFWKWDWEERMFFVKALKKYKNITRIDYRFAKFGGYVFIGARGHSFSGRVKTRAYKRHRKKLESLFKKFRKEKIVFVTHNSPYNTKLDLITAKRAHKKAKGKHFGSKMFRRIIDKHQPILSISGHIDEAWGKQKIKKTLAINCGAVHDGRGAIVNINDKGEIKVKFIK